MSELSCGIVFLSGARQAAAKSRPSDFQPTEKLLKQERRNETDRSFIDLSSGRGGDVFFFKLKVRVCSLFRGLIDEPESGVVDIALLFLCLCIFYQDSSIHNILHRLFGSLQGRTWYLISFFYCCYYYYYYSRLNS